jgi:predicted DNA repair protein MutK
MSRLRLTGILTMAFGLFLIQRKGTGTVGRLFGPITLAWFLALGVGGIASIVQTPEVLAAVHPGYGLAFLVEQRFSAVFVLGAVVLAGGMATRFGGVVKAVVPVLDGKSFLELKHDDLARVSAKAGRALVALSPWLMKGLALAGTVAMFLVGGGILLHGIPVLGHAVEAWFFGLGWVTDLLSNLAGGVAGLLAGLIAAAVWQLICRLKK